MTDELTQRLFGLAIADDAAPPSYSTSLPASEPVIASRPSTNIQSRSSTKRSAKHGAYVVFIGKNAGVYRTWKDCFPNVNGVKHNSYQGYPSFAEAGAAFDVARARGLTFSCANTALTVARQTSETRLTSEDLILCLAFLDDDASNAIAPPGHFYYTVFKGSQPGVYRTYLEVVLATTGLAGAVHGSYRAREEAITAFKRELDSGRVYRLNRAL
ncbi:hypothetical protein BD626DRAFT_419743 [Schizophyllum amplum]|uniref:Ribonuclease H1 N-terminal domain-containing protein n=1 Tax=Schizophyllum amplum TaxID=97359 RepID=A0A550BRQ8_9AGAR|nr:hypothetical protein BD626DRAFT_419743 [Auriculariopsis ampla]